MLTSHNYRVTSVAWSEDGKLASGSYDKKVKIWFVDSTGTFACKSTLTGHRYATPPPLFPQHASLPRTALMLYVVPAYAHARTLVTACHELTNTLVIACH